MVQDMTGLSPSPLFEHVSMGLMEPIARPVGPPRSAKREGAPQTLSTLNQTHQPALSGAALVSSMQPCATVCFRVACSRGSSGCPCYPGYPASCVDTSSGAVVNTFEGCLTMQCQQVVHTVLWKDGLLCVWRAPPWGL